MINVSGFMLTLTFSFLVSHNRTLLHFLWFEKERETINSYFYKLKEMKQDLLVKILVCIAPIIFFPS